MRKTTAVLTICLILIILAAVGCSKPQEESEIKISNWSMGLGPVDNTLDKTKLTYSIDITNKNPKTINISSITLVTGEKIKARITDGEKTIMLDKELLSNEVTQIKGELIIDTKGMDKEQISNLEPFITGIKVLSEETINID